jgi:predicted DNA-binding ribbon-helix-helix protein
MVSKRVGLKARSSSIQAAITASKGEAPSNKQAVEAKGKVSKGKPIGLSVRLEPEMHDQLRKIAFEKRVSIHSLILEGLEVVLRKYPG